MRNDPDSDWHLKEWAALRNKRQADLTKDLGWLPPRVSKIWNGGIPYRRDLVIELARWLGIRPHELLMTPEEAMALRRLRETARLIAAEPDGPPFEPAPTPEKAA
jgi:transcriptional regulator with XRE-family HTH domain